MANEESAALSPAPAGFQSGRSGRAEVGIERHRSIRRRRMHGEGREIEDEWAEGGVDRQRSEKTTEDVEDRRKESGKQRGMQGIYTSRKATGTEAYDALPDRGCAKPIRAMPGWK